MNSKNFMRITRHERESAKKEAVIDSDCLQDTEGDFRDPDKRDNIRSEKMLGDIVRPNEQSVQVA